MDATLIEAIGKYGVLPALALYAASLLIPRLFAARTDIAEAGARTDVIETLAARLSSLEQAQREAWAAFEEERRKRIGAEDEVARLSRRVASLEDQLRKLGHEPT